MSEPHSTSEAASSGRESNGTFAAGNQFGRGNPFARKCAAFRAALMETVTEQDIKDIAIKLRDDAKAGDKAAVKLLFQYVIGKPQPAVDPDTLDVQEMRTFAANALPSEALEELQRRLPLRMLLQIWPIFLAAREQQCANELSDQLAATDAREARRAERARRKAERKQRRQQARAQQQQTAPAKPPSTDGSNGPAADLAGAAPSTNGDLGEQTLQTILNWLRRQRGPSNGDGHA
jgi:hypothetical protein